MCKTHKEHVHCGLQCLTFFVCKRESGRGIYVPRDFDPLESFCYQIMEQEVSAAPEILPSYKELHWFPRVNRIRAAYY